ncbi:hypothetical protein [Nocardioides sp. CFH 31398]|uniref:hypothetical protein n=1 Tax=Nocardioides sp. CFH 31398 TaxID=2919579 RepID=UPI001F059EA8|nr:hypothetical protein [Nocardioides sp. CFH 31398]MCH1866799.1 hypothetical protein [Nocardioides sp. CFH 31398]
MISSRRDLSPFVLLSAVIVLLLAATPAEAATTAAVTARTPRTTVEVTIVGCDGCRVHPVQNKDRDLTYGAQPKTTRDAEDTLVFTVPRARTRQMAFLVSRRSTSSPRRACPR